MLSPDRRLPHVDALKALAAQAIVLHHLVSYGPIARAAHMLLPTLADLLQDYGRLAVQVFLVVGGYLSARSLWPGGSSTAEALPGLLWQRYLRLTLPFMAAVGLALGASLLVAPWLPELVPASVSLKQLLAHGLLLHGLLGQESLTAGAWYVAIDFQLFAMLAGLLALARRLPQRWRPLRQPAGLALVAGGVLASAWVFNRDTGLDHLGLYFFAAYGLGALVHALGRTRHGRWLGAALALALLAALAADFRSRLALALATAALLALAQARPWRPAPALAARLSDWSRHSYALFLLHFPVLLLANGLVAAHVSEDAIGLTGFALLATWLCANRLAPPFHRWVELPATRLDARQTGRA